MGRRNRILVGALIAALAACLIGGVVWFFSHYTIVSFRVYARDARVLRLNDQALSTRAYDALRRQLPQCQIFWDVPFQQGRYANDTTSITVDTLSDQDVQALDYFTDLQTVDARGCTDYEQLQELCQRRPEVEVLWGIHLGDELYDWDTKKLELAGIAQEQLQDLDHMTRLQAVVLVGGGDVAHFQELIAYCQDREVEVDIRLGDQDVSRAARSVTAAGVTGEELELLPLLAGLNKLTLEDPQAPAEVVTALPALYPDVDITWEIEIWGVRCSSDQSWEEELDLSAGTVGTLAEVERAMAYFPEATKVYLGDCGLDNDDIAEYRERVRSDYKVAWLVHCGRVPTRTDATSFMPSRDGVGNFRDDESYNLRYCEDLIAIDIGHMGNVRDVSFLAYMPELKYLILAHTSVSDISAISSCKKLIFLELDWSPISDYTPLLGCTALEDLNIGKYGADVTPICSMTWLKNVWCIFRPGAAGKIAAALPDTHVVASGNATVSSGWRRLPNYYDMRDALGMYYMEW